MAFNLPQQLSLKTLPAADPTDWVRPSDWPTITDAANEIQFLVNDQYQAVYALQTTCTGIGNLYIDWGDGTINTIGATGATTTQHTYATGGTGATAGTPCSLGYTTFKIRVYGDSGVVPTQAQAMPNSTVAGANSNLSRGNGYLEAYYGDGTITSIRALWGFGMNSLYGIGAGTYPLLQYVKLPATVTGTDCIYAFYAAYNLQKVVMPTSMPNATIIDYMFYGTSLRQLVLPSDMTGVTSAIAAFGLMFWLTSVSLPASWNSCTTVQQMFTTSEKLKSVELPALGACTTFSNLFNGCGGLMQVKFNALHSSPNQTLTFTTTFSGCNNLQYVFMPATCASGTIFSGLSFSTLPSLLTFTYPSNVNLLPAANLNTAFSNCPSLLNVVLPQVNQTVITSLNFQNCYSLQSVTLFPSHTAATISLANAFSGCYALGSITIPNAWNLNTLGNAFTNCWSLTSVTLPQSAQNSITSMASTFQTCFALQTVNLPTSLTGLTNLSSCFNACYRLPSVVFPATLNAVTTMVNMFSNCYILTTVTMPTSCTALTVSGISGIISSCYSLNSFTLPATVNAGITTMTLASNSFGLQTLTMPTTQLTSAAVSSGFLNANYSLTTINNLDKVGSTTVGVDWSAAFTNTPSLLSISLPNKVSKFAANGSATNYYQLNSLRITGTGVLMYTGSSPQISVQYTMLSTAALVTLFNDIVASGVSSKTINITGATGAAGLSAAQRQIITDAPVSWTIIG